MLSSITPLGERGRQMRWSVTTATYIVGSVIGGSITGVILGGLGALMISPIGIAPRWLLVLLAVLAALAAAFDSGLWGLRLPTIHRQVNENWLTRYRGWVYGGGFGIQLGLGITTIVSSASVYLWLVTDFLVHDVRAGAVIGAVFGLSRALVLLLGWRARDVHRLSETHRQIQRWEQPIATATIAGSGLIAIVAGVTAAST